MARSKRNNEKIEYVVSMRERLRKSTRRRSTAKKSASNSDKDYSTSRSTSASRAEKRRKYKRASISATAASRSGNARRSSRRRSYRGSRNGKKLKQRITVPMKNKRHSASTSKNRSSSKVAAARSKSTNNRSRRWHRSTGSNESQSGSSEVSSEFAERRRSRSVSFRAHSLSRGPPLEDVCCNLKLPIFIESIQKIHVSPKDEQIHVETKTILKSSDTPFGAKQNGTKLCPTVDHQSLAQEKGQTEEMSDNKVSVGKNILVFERNTVIKKAELQENLARQSKKEYNSVGRCRVEEVSGPLSIHCAQSTVVCGEIYQKKELISVFLIAEPELFKQETVDDLLTKTLIREQLGEVGGDRIKMQERMTSSGDFILMLERDVRIACNNEMWTNENEYVTSETRLFEFDRDNNGEMRLLETGHSTNKTVLNLNPALLDRSTTPKQDSAAALTNDFPIIMNSVTDPNYKVLYGAVPDTPDSYFASVKSLQSEDTQSTDKIYNRLCRFDRKIGTPDKSSAAVVRNPEAMLNTSRKSLNLTQPQSPASPSTVSKSKINTPKKVAASTKDVFVTHDKTTKATVISPASVSDGNSNSRKKEDVKNAAIRSKAIQERTKTPKKTDSSVVAAVSDDNTSFVPAWNRSPRSKSLLSLVIPATTPVKLNPSAISKVVSPGEENNDETLTPKKPTLATKKPARLINLVDKEIDICTYDSENAEIKRSVVVNVECEINGKPYWLMTNYKIKSDAKKIDFAAEKIVCEGKTIWQACEDRDQKSPTSKCRITRYASVSAVKKNPANPSDTSK